MNRATIIGNLGSDPEEIKGTDGCKFSIATNEKWTDKKGQKQERTEWHRITCWGKLAEVCMQYLSKGRQVCVTGSIKTDEYEKDGETRYSTGITARDVEFLSGGDSGGGGGREKKKRRSGGRKSAPKTEFYDDDEIPF